MWKLWKVRLVNRGPNREEETRTIPTKKGKDEAGKEVCNVRNNKGVQERWREKKTRMTKETMKVKGKERETIEKCIIKIIRRFFLCGIVGTSI
jgi:hypothetical protein